VLPNRHLFAALFLCGDDRRKLFEGDVERYFLGEEAEGRTYRSESKAVSVVAR